MKIVIISDTHGMLPKINVPDGDLLIHCGDLCDNGTLAGLQKVGLQLAQLPHRYKIVIAGNHDWPFQQTPQAARDTLPGCIYLENQTVEVEGLKIYGTPWQPEFRNWAFNLPRGSDKLKANWDLIPDDTDILITHTPPQGILDTTDTYQQVGCGMLRLRVEEIAPKLHCFGHIHEGYGTMQLGPTTFVNAACLNVKYKPVNKPIVIEL